jgi:hypothetical protein
MIADLKAASDDYLTIRWKDLTILDDRIGRLNAGNRMIMRQFYRTAIEQEGFIWQRVV